MKQILLFILLGLGAGAVIAGSRWPWSSHTAARGSSTSPPVRWRWSPPTPSGRCKTSSYSGPRCSRHAAFTIVLGTSVELVCFRPLRTSSPLAKLVASLGILLILQATVLLWFGSARSDPQPSILPHQHRRCVRRPIPANRFWMAAIVVVIAVVLAGLYRWTRFGLATRAAAENEVSAMLAGLSPNQLSMANTVMAARSGRRRSGIVAAPLAQPTRARCCSSSCRPGAALFAGFTSLGIACIAGFGIGMVNR